MVLDGHDGSKACDFVQKYLPSVLLRSEFDGPEEMALKAVRYAFQNTEREFFLKIDPHITRKITLQIEMNVSSLCWECARVLRTWSASVCVTCTCLYVRVT